MTGNSIKNKVSLSWKYIFFQYIHRWKITNKVMKVSTYQFRFKLIFAVFMTESAVPTLPPCVQFASFRDSSTVTSTSSYLDNTVPAQTFNHARVIKWSVKRKSNHVRSIMYYSKQVLGCKNSKLCYFIYFIVKKTLIALTFYFHGRVYHQCRLPSCKLHHHWIKQGYVCHQRSQTSKSIKINHEFKLMKHFWYTPEAKLDRYYIPGSGEWWTEHITLVILTCCIVSSSVGTETESLFPIPNLPPAPYPVPYT